MRMLTNCCQRGSLMCVLKRLSSSGMRSERADSHGRAIGGDFVHRVADVARIKAHHEDRVSPSFGRRLLHPLNCFYAAVREKLGIAADLPADNRLQPRTDITH